MDLRHPVPLDSAPYRALEKKSGERSQVSFAQRDLTSIGVFGKRDVLFNRDGRYVIICGA